MFFFLSGGGGLHCNRCHCHCYTSYLRNVLVNKLLINPFSSNDGYENKRRKEEAPEFQQSMWMWINNLINLQELMDVVSVADTTKFELPLRPFDLLTLLKEIYAKVVFSLLHIVLVLITKLIKS